MFKSFPFFLLFTSYSNLLYVWIIDKKNQTEIISKNCLVLNPHPHSSTPPVKLSNQETFSSFRIETQHRKNISWVRNEWRCTFFKQGKNGGPRWDPEKRSTEKIYLWQPYEKLKTPASIKYLFFEVKPSWQVFKVYSSGISFSKRIVRQGSWKVLPHQLCKQPCKKADVISQYTF